MAPRCVARAWSVLGLNGFENGDVLSLHLEQISDAVGLAAAGGIKDGSDER